MMNCIKIIEIMTMMQMLETVNIKIKFENRTNNANLITMLRKMPVNRMTETNASDAHDEHVEVMYIKNMRHIQNNDNYKAYANDANMDMLNMM